MRCGSRCVIVMGSCSRASRPEWPAHRTSPRTTWRSSVRRCGRTRTVVVASVLAPRRASQVFWPVYNAYQGDMVSHYDRVLSSSTPTPKAYDQR